MGQSEIPFSNTHAHKKKKPCAEELPSMEFLYC